LNTKTSNETWEKAIGRLLASVDLTERDPGPVVRNFGDDPTAVIVGPTGSGKTSFLNLLLGCRLLPEGLGHTTPVPTIIRRDNSPRLVALSSDARPVKGIEIVELPAEQFANELPNCQNTLLNRLLTRPDSTQQKSLRERFWKPAFDAARQGGCVAISLTAPLEWLPEGVRLVDMPGYEGWYPDDCSDLHQLVTQWLDTADMALFIASVSRLKVGYGTEYLNYHHANGRWAALLVNQIDNINPGSDFESAIAEYREEVCGHLQNQGYPDPTELPLVFGCTRLERESVLGDGLNPVLQSMLAAGHEFAEALGNIHGEWSRRKAARQRKQTSERVAEADAAIENYRQSLQQTCDELRKKAHGRYVSTKTRRRLVDGVSRAIGRTDDPMQLESVVAETLTELMVQCRNKAVGEYWAGLEKAVRAKLRNQAGSLGSSELAETAFAEQHPSLETIFVASEADYHEAVGKVIAAGNAQGVIDWAYLMFNPSERIARIKAEAKEQVKTLISFAMLEHTFAPIDRILRKDFNILWDDKSGIKASIATAVERQTNQEFANHLAVAHSTMAMHLLHETIEGGSELQTIPSSDEFDGHTLRNLPQMASRPVTVASKDQSTCSRFIYTDTGGRLILVEAQSGTAHWQNLTIRAGWAPRSAGPAWAIHDGQLRVFFFCENGQLHYIRHGNDVCEHSQIKTLPADYRPASGPVGIDDSKGLVLVYRDVAGSLHLLDGAENWKRKNLTKTTKSPKAFGTPAVYQWSDGLHVVYRSQSGNLNELLRRGSSWLRYPLTQRLKFPKAAGDPVGIAGDGHALYYCSTDQHLHELAYDGIQWTRTRLTGVDDHPVSLGDPVAVSGESTSIFYRTTKRESYQLKKHGTWWQCIRLFD